MIDLIYGGHRFHLAEQYTLASAEAEAKAARVAARSSADRDLPVCTMKLRGEPRSIRFSIAAGVPWLLEELSESPRAWVVDLTNPDFG